MQTQPCFDCEAGLQSGKEEFGRARNAKHWKFLLIGLASLGMIVLGTSHEKQFGVAGRRLLTSIVVPGRARVAPIRTRMEGTFHQVANNVNKLRAALGDTHVCSKRDESQTVLADLEANIKSIHDTTQAEMTQLIDSKEQALAEASEATAKLNLAKVGFACLMLMVLGVICLKRLRPLMRTSDPIHRNEEGADIEIQGEMSGPAPAMRISGIEPSLETPFSANVGGSQQVAHVAETRARLKPLMPRFVPTRTRAPVMAAGMDDNGESLTEEWNNLKAGRGTHMGRADDIVRGVQTVWVLLSNFGNPRRSMGVYIMKDEENQWPEKFFALAFERYDHAEKYAYIASTSELPLTPIEWPAEQLRAFCYHENFDVAFARQFVIPSSTSEQYEFDLQSKVVRGMLSRESDDRSPSVYNRDAMNTAPRGFDPSSFLGSPVEQPRLHWVVIINPGRDNEGVYVLQDMERKRQDRVLAFEAREDAKRFADQLQGFDVVAPMQWDPTQLRDFCQQGGYETELVSEGVSINPPEINEYDTEAFSNPSGARNIAADDASLPLHRRLHLNNMRALLEDRLRRSEGGFMGDEWQA